MIKVSTDKTTTDPLFYFLVNKIVDDVKKTFINSLEDVKPLIESDNVKFHALDVILSALVSSFSTIILSMCDSMKDDKFLKNIEEALPISLQHIRDKLKEAT